MGNAYAYIKNDTPNTINCKTYNYSDLVRWSHWGSYDIDPYTEQRVDAAADGRGLHVVISGNGWSNPVYHATNGEHIEVWNIGSQASSIVVVSLIFVTSSD